MLVNRVEGLVRKPEPADEEKIGKSTSFAVASKTVAVPKDCPDNAVVVAKAVLVTPALEVTLVRRERVVVTPTA